MFLTAEGEPFSRDHLTWTVREHIDAAKTRQGRSLPPASATAWRRTCTRTEPTSASSRQILGHEDIKTTQIYTQVALRALQQVYAATHPAALLEPGNAPPLPRQPASIQTPKPCRRRSNRRPKRTAKSRTNSPV